MEINSIDITTPIPLRQIKKLNAGDFIRITGSIYTGRDAALPRLVQSIRSGKNMIDLDGMVIMHTAVSQAGIAPTTSNKEEIEESIAPLSKAGVLIHIGKGAISPETVSELQKYNSIFVITPPVAALLTSKVISIETVAFPEEGIEAIHLLKVDKLPGIVAVAHGKSVY